MQLGGGTTSSVELTMHTFWTRLGPVYLYWSEWNDAAVVGPDQGAWGGCDVWRCTEHPDWQGGEGHADEIAHAAGHGIFVASNTGAAA